MPPRMEARAALDEQIALQKQVQAGALSKNAAKQRMYSGDAQVERKVAEAAEGGGASGGAAKQPRVS